VGKPPSENTATDNALIEQWVRPDEHVAGATDVATRP
jgi:hypothetical protein